MLGLLVLLCGIRVAAASDSEATAYVRDALGRIETVTTANGTTRYTYFDDGIIASVDHPDGSRDTFDHGAVLVGRRVAKAFREADATSVGDQYESLSSAESFNRFAFTGHIYEPETGLYLAGSRHYDPQIGRFITQDSFLGRPEDPPSLHRYTYGHANPTRYVDPSGHEAFQLYMRYSGLQDPAQEASVRRAERRALGSVLGTGDFVARSVFGLVQGAGHLAAGAFGYSPSIEAGKEFLDETQRFFEHPVDNTSKAYNEALDRAQDQIDQGNEVQAGREFTRDVTAPVAAAVIGGIEGGIRAGRRAWSVMERPRSPGPPNVVPIGEALASGEPFTVTEDGAMLSRRVAGGSQGAVLDLAPVPVVARRIGKWTAREVAGRTVYQRHDIFDPLKASSWQDPVSGRWKRGTNVDRMADGLAPIARDGKSVNLHHVLQGEPGPLAEVPSFLHNKLPHKLRGSVESFRNDPALKRQFEEYRGEYWKERSRDLRPDH